MASAVSSAVDHVQWLALTRIEAPVAVCSSQGVLLATTAQARELLRRAASSAAVDMVPARLWAMLEQVENGHAVEWRSTATSKAVVGCTRYAYGDAYLLLMKEVSLQLIASSARLQGSRLEAIGRLVASIAHELRNGVSSIVYSADLLSLGDAPDLNREDIIEEILRASRRLQETVAGLLDYAKLGPSVSVPVSLREVLTRAQGFLRSHYHSGSHQLVVAIDPGAEWVSGNSIVIEQIFVNLLLNAAQSNNGQRVRVEVRSDIARPQSLQASPRTFVRTRVIDDGAGVPVELRDSIFEPFFTTRPDGTGLGLSNALDAIGTLGGTIELEECREGACFSAYLPAASRDNSEAERGLVRY